MKSLEETIAQKEWNDDSQIDLRTKIALKVLSLIFRVLSPYRFGHQFEADIKQLEKDIYGL